MWLNGSVGPDGPHFPRCPVRYQELTDIYSRYAAIDPGSTGTRAVIAVAKIDKATGKRKVVDILRIQDFREDDDRDRRTTRGEWPSKCCPFDGPPFLVGYDADSQDKLRTISIKAIPYFRTQDDDGHPFTKALYDHSKSLRSRAERQRFADILDSILFQFLYGFFVSSLVTSPPCPSLTSPCCVPRYLIPPFILSFPQAADVYDRLPILYLLERCDR